MLSNLTVVANFFIDNEERLLRMKDSLQSMKEISINQYIVNVRGRFAEQTINHLKSNIDGKKLKIYSLQSSLGWFYDTSRLMHLINTSYVLTWIEDHICMAPKFINNVIY